MLKIANLLNNNAPGFRFGLGNENVPSPGRENVARRCSVHETGQLRRQPLLSAAWRPRNQVGVREPVLLMGSAEEIERCISREGHVRFSILTPKQALRNAKKSLPKFRSRSCLGCPSRRWAQCDLVRAQPVLDML